MIYTKIPEPLISSAHNSAFVCKKKIGKTGKVIIKIDDLLLENVVLLDAYIQADQKAEMNQAKLKYKQLGTFIFIATLKNT